MWPARPDLGRLLTRRGFRLVPPRNPRGELDPDKVHKRSVMAAVLLPGFSSAPQAG